MLDSFTLDPELVPSGCSSDLQKKAHLLKLLDGMRIDGFDNDDPSKVHPAFLTHPMKEEEFDRLTRELIGDLVSNSTGVHASIQLNHTVCGQGALSGRRNLDGWRVYDIGWIS